MSIPVNDPFRAAEDPALSTLAQALHPVFVKRAFKRRLPALAGEDGFVRPLAIRVTRHKPGRRCVIEYDVEVQRPGRETERLTLIGKVRRRRYGMADFRLQKAVWDAGFQTTSPDGIAVPEPIGVISQFNLWLQRKVPGRALTGLLASPGGAALARRVAEAAHKLHRAGIPTNRRHTMDDELRILGDCLRTVALAEPRWADRLERLLWACVRLAADVPVPKPAGIHRDFYAEQVIVSDSHLYLLDFDLYCWGDPGLDIGNFLGHITEQALRLFGNPGALAVVEQALEQRFVELAGEGTRPAVRAYALLTLVRHIFLSTRFPERRSLTERLIELCEERLGVFTGRPVSVGGRWQP